MATKEITIAKIAVQTLADYCQEKTKHFSINLDLKNYNNYDT